MDSFKQNPLEDVKLSEERGERRRVVRHRPRKYGRFWYERSAKSIIRKLRDGRIPVEIRQELLWEVANDRLQQAIDLDIWKETTNTVCFRDFGEYRSYEDGGRWVHRNGGLKLMEPLMFVQQDEMRWLLSVDPMQNFVMDRVWTGGSHQFYGMHTSMTVSDCLWELGFGQNRKWSVFSPQGVSQGYRARLRLLKFKRERDEELRALDRLIKEFTDNDVRDDNGFPLWDPKAFAEGLWINRERDRRRARGRTQGFGVIGEESVMERVQDFISQAVAKAANGRVDDVVKRAIIGLPLCLLSMWRHHSFVDWSVAILQYVNALGLGTAVAKFVVKYMKKAFELCRDMWQKGDDAEMAVLAEEVDETPRIKQLYETLKARLAKKGKAHSADDSSPYEKIGMMVGAAGGLLAVVFACIGIKGVPTSDKDLTTFLTRFGLLGRCMTSVEKIYEAGEKFAELLTRAFRLYILKQDPAHVIQYYEMHAWSDKVMKMVTSDFESKIKCNYEFKLEYDSLVREGDVILKRLDTLKVPIVERVRFNRAYEALARVRPQVATSGAGHAELRPAPIIVQFVGDSGCGKSSLLWPFFMDMMVKMGVKEYSKAKEAVYYRYAADQSKHWDGCHNGVRIVVVDDIFTKKDSEASPNAEVDEVIRMSNNSSWPLPMADLSDKGNVYFQAPLVVWTSNREQYTFESRTNPEAIITRINLRYRVVPKAEFAGSVTIGQRTITRLLREKISAELENDSSKITEFVTFERLDPQASGRVVLRSGMTYAEMVEEVGTALMDSLSRHDRMVAGVEKHFERALRQHEQNKEVAAGYAGDIMKPSCSKDGRGTVQGWFFETRQVAKTATGCDCRRPQTWSDWKDSRHHYLVSELIAQHAVFLEGVFTDEQEEGIEEFNVDDCIVSDKRLTLTEQRAILAMIVRYGRVGCRSFFHHLPFSNHLSECHEHISGMSNAEMDTRLEKIREYHLEEGSAQSFFRLCSTYMAAEEVISDFGAIVIPVIMFVVMMTVSMGSTVWAQKKVQTHALACDVLRKELKRQPLGRVDVGLAYSHAEKTPGRARGHVEAKRRGCRHSEECLEELDRVVQRSCEVLFDGDAETPFRVKLRRLQDSQVETWQCQCDNGTIQSVLDQNAHEIGVLALQNMYKLEKRSGDSWSHIMNITMLKGRLALANRHLQLSLEDPDAELRIVNSIRPKGYEFKVKKLRYMVPKRAQDKEKDLMILELPRFVHQHRDITDKFISSDEMGKASEFESVCITGHAVVSHASILRQYFADHAIAVDGYMDMTAGRVYAGTIRRYIKYKVQTVEGDCGALVVAYDKRINNKIIGIHAGGMNSDGYAGFAQPVSQECVKDLISLFTPRQEDSKVASEPPVAEELKTVTVGHMIFPSLALDGDMEYGTTQMVPHRAYGTNILPSPLHGVMQEPCTAPAVLRPVVKEGVLVDPLDMARRKVAPVVPPELDPELFQRSVDGVQNMICSNVNYNDMRVCSMEEAIAGVVGDPAYPPLNRKSSAGFGWNGTKKRYLGSDEYVFDHPEVVRRVEEGLEKLKRGERLNTVFVDTLKDERRDLARVEQLKTRMFCAGEMIFTIIFRMYFLGWAAHMWRRRREVECCVGIDALGVDWHMLALDMKSKGDNIIAGDFSNYDGTLPAEVVWAVLDVVSAFYSNATSEDQLVRVALWSDIANSWHVTGNTIYLWAQSNPSGCPITSLLNSVVHSILARYVWLGLARERCPSMCSLRDYRAMVVHRNYGDDDLWSVSSEVLGWFNQQSLTSEFAKIGMVYTDETKKGTVLPARSLTEVEFLKRSFRWEPLIARWVGPLRLSVIMEMPMWVHTSSDVYLQTAETLVAAQRELALHPVEVYEEKMEVMRVGAEKLRRHVTVEFFARGEVLLERRQKECK